MKKIPLSCYTKQQLYALVDDEDFERVNQYKWRAVKGQNTFYALRRFEKQAHVYYVRMHNFIVDTPVGCIVDHLDRDGLNNQKQNLRSGPRWANHVNYPTHNHSSRYRGVSKTRRGKATYFEVNLQLHGKQYHAGYTRDERHGGLLYDFWATLLHGDYAVTNFTVVSTTEKPIGGSNGQVPEGQRNSANCGLSSPRREPGMETP